MYFSITENEDKSNTFTLTQILKEFLNTQKEALDTQNRALAKISQRQVIHYQTLIEFYQLSIHMVQV